MIYISIGRARSGCILFYDIEEHQKSFIEVETTLSSIISLGSHRFKSTLHVGGLFVESGQALNHLVLTGFIIQQFEIDKSRITYTLGSSASGVWLSY